MMKRILALVAVLVFVATAAFGAVQAFSKFSLDVPAGWSASEQDETVTLIADDQTASLTISIASTEGKSLEVVANGLSEAFKGTKPEVDADGDYTFTFDNGNGVTSHALITGADDMFCAFVMTGVENKGDEIQAILGSLKLKE